MGIVSILPSPHPSSVQISSSAPCSQTPSVYIPPGCMFLPVQMEVIIFALPERFTYDALLSCLHLRPKSSFITLRQIWVSCRWVQSLKRRYICRLQLPLVITIAILGFESCGAYNYILLFHTRDSPIWRVNSPYLYPLWTGWSSYSTKQWVSFSSPPITHRAKVEVFESACTWITPTATRPAYNISARTA
jgi:hypothetical protein